jgi:tellurite resistance protein TerC
VLYFFGAFLVYTGVRMLFTSEEEDTPGETWVMRQLRKYFPITEEFHGSKFRVVLNGRRWLTPLAVALVLVETTDLIFAVDSIPAIFAITADPFLVFTSNVFAILCLRSLYFGLAGLIERFKYLKVSLSIILALVGIKMLASQWLVAWIGESLNFWMLGLVAGILLAGALASSASPRAPTTGERKS